MRNKETLRRWKDAPQGDGGGVIPHSSLVIPKCVFCTSPEESPHLFFCHSQMYLLGIQTLFLTFFVFRSDRIVIFTPLIYVESLFLHILREVEIWIYPLVFWIPASAGMTIMRPFSRLRIRSFRVNS